MVAPLASQIAPLARRTPGRRELRRTRELAAGTLPAGSEDGTSTGDAGMAKVTLATVSETLADLARQAEGYHQKLASLAGVVHSMSVTEKPRKAGQKGKWPTFGDWLKFRISEAKMTEKSAAEMSGVAVGTLRNYIYAGRTPNLGAVLRLATAFNVDLNELHDIAEFSDSPKEVN